MDTGILSQAAGLLACAGAVGVIVMVALVSLATGVRHGRRDNRSNPVVQPPTAPPYADDDFGGVPTTGPVQEYEREYRPDPMIGSSGFATRTYEPEEEDDEQIAR